MRSINKTTVKRALIAILAFMISVFLPGCQDQDESPGFLFRRMFGFTDGFTEIQSNWIILWESILVVFLVLLTILLFALFIRYRRTEKQAIESKKRERSLVRENKELDHLNRTKTEFFQNMSHDFKTPLTVISTSVLNALDVLDFGDFGEDSLELKECLNLAQSEVMRLSRLVDGALKHAQLYSDHHLAEKINLYRLLRRIERTYVAFLERHGNKLIISLPPELPTVYGNIDMLINVFSNLITNANRYTKKGEIIISAKADDGILYKDVKNKKRYVSITVSDNGSGVNPEILENIFERGASEGGSGLGLSICRTAIEAYDGSITVKSEKGVGTKVTFTIPVYESKVDDTEMRLAENEQQ